LAAFYFGGRAGRLFLTPLSQGLAAAEFGGRADSSFCCSLTAFCRRRRRFAESDEVLFRFAAKVALRAGQGGGVKRAKLPAAGETEPL